MLHLVMYYFIYDIHICVSYKGSFLVFVFLSLFVKINHFIFLAQIWKVMSYILSCLSWLYYSLCVINFA